MRSWVIVICHFTEKLNIDKMDFHLVARFLNISNLFIYKILGKNQLNFNFRSQII